jgi:ring-1,2-phenylacetyl-CoA epoxidase subunit PaaE
MSAATDFHALSIEHVERQAGSVVVTFGVPPALTETFAFKPGQHLAIRHMIDGEELRRNYSICSGPGMPLRVAIRGVDGGRFSSWANANLRVGYSLEVMPPVGRFVLPPSDGTNRRIIAIAAGSGITPIIGLALQALDHERRTQFTLIYGNHGPDSTLFAEELEFLKDRHLGRFELIHILSRHDDVDMPMFRGRIDAAKIKAMAAKLIRFDDAAHIYLCGPGSMIKDVRQTLMALGLPTSKIHHEFFAPGGGSYRTKAPVPAPAVVASAVTEVVAILDGVRHPLKLAAGEHVLAAALKAGVRAPYSCTGGMCCTCRARIIEGSAEMTVNYSLEQWEIDRGFVLTCQAVPTSPRLIIDYDAM